MEEFFIDEDLFVSLLKETALEVILFFIVLFSVVSLNPIFFAVAIAWRCVYIFQGRCCRQ